jgi:thymidylate kinase
VRRGSQWAVFGDGGSFSVELVPASAWRLPPAELDALFTAARPLPGMSHVSRPAPEHALLILARRFAATGSLNGKLRSRLDGVLAEDPDAWAETSSRAALWGVEKAIELLARAARADVPATAVERVAMQTELLASARGPRERARMVGRRLAGRRRRGVVVALSGLDGAGKSSQARLLRDALAGVGIDAVIEWTPDYNLLYALPKPVKRLLLQLLGRLRPRAAVQVAPRLEPSSLQDRRTIFRQQSDPLASLLAAITALVNAVSQRRATGRHLRRGRSVICDRYTLDSAVHLRYRYGPARRFKFQISLIRALSPKPLRAYLLDVTPEVALSRKVDQHALEELEQQRDLYLEELPRLGVRRLDGTRPASDLCAEMATEIWLARG